MASLTLAGHAADVPKIEANERTCDIFPLAEGRNSLDWALARLRGFALENADFEIF